MENQIREDRKAILLRICSRIVNADERAIKIMRETPLCNLRVVNRASRNNKDPNPLSSTMSQINTKYPITVDSLKAENMGIPSYLLGPDDAHRHGRRLAKKEVVDWFIENSEVPTQDLKRVIDTLFSKPRKDVQRYYDIKWNEATVKFGPVMLERRPIPTQVPELDVPRGLRNKLIAQVLMPEYTIPYQKLDPRLTSKMASLAETKLDVKLALVQQARILTDQMDPKIRMIPSLPGSAETVGPMRHALCQSNFLVIVQIKAEKGSNDYTQDLKLLAESVIWALHKQKRNVDKVKDIISRTTILGRSVTEILSSTDTNVQVAKIKFLMSFMGFPITMSSEMRNTTFSPCVAKVSQAVQTNRAGVKFISYMGVETVHFRRDAVRGQFCHDASIILSIICNFTDESELRHALASIAAYCRKDGESTFSKSKTDIYEDIFKKFVEKPWQVISLTQRQYAQEDWTKAGRRGILEIVSESEFEESPAFECKYAFDETSLLLFNSQTRQSFEVSLADMNFPTLSDMVEMPSGVLDDFLPPRKLLRRKMAFYHTNFVMLLSRIHRRNFLWENEAFLHLTKGESKAYLSQSAWLVMNKILGDDRDSCDPMEMKPIICLAYCFCRIPNQPLSAWDIKPFVNWCENIAIDFTAQEGVLIVDENGMYKLFGEPLGVGETVDYAEVLNGFMPGFSFSSNYDSELPVRKMYTLLKQSDQIHDGESYTVYAGGRAYTCTKMHSIGLFVAQTIERQLKSKTYLDCTPDFSFTEKWKPILKRRHGDDDPDDNDEISAAKHSKVDSEDQ